MSAIKPQDQEAQKPPHRTNAQRTTPQHIVFKLQKIKDRVLKGWGGGEWWDFILPIQESRITFNFSSETMQDRRRWTEKFQVFEKEKPAQLEFCVLQNYPLKVKEKSNFLRQAKIERICQ